MDLHALSAHRRDKQWADRLDYELDAGRRWLRDLRAAAGPRALVDFIEGNHESRLARQVESKMPELRRLSAMTIPHLLGLEDVGIRYHDHGRGVRVPCGQGQVVYCFHGHEVRGRYKNSTPLNYAAAFGRNVHLGHSHRVSLDHVVAGGKRLFAVEGGYLGKPRSAAFTYAGPAPSAWTRAFMFYDAEKKTNPYPEIVLV